jgi:hypothetical protein
MFKSTKAITLGAVAITAASLFAFSTASATHSWGGYHWKKFDPAVNLRIGNNVSGVAWNAALSDAVDDWNSSPRVDDLNSSPRLALTLEPGSTNPKNCKAVNGTVQVCSSAYGNNGWLGLAQIWLSGGHISQGITKLNDSYFASGFYDTPAWRALVTCQELGHDFGLSHQDEAFNNANLDTCMDYTSDPETNQHPNDHDYEMLEAIYKHGDETIILEPPKRGKPAGLGNASEEAFGGNSPADWGRATSHNAQGKPDTFVKNLESGKRLVTHVFWVPERKNKR